VSTLTEPPQAGTQVGPPASGRSRLRRLRFPLAVGGVVVAAAAVAALVATGPSGDLDPASGSSAGSRAVARILQREGVAVTRTTDPARAATARGTVVVVHPELLAPRTLASATAAAARVVLVEPAQRELDAVAPQVRAADVVPAQTLPPACAAADAQAGPARAGGQLYTVVRGVRADVCFPLGSDADTEAVADTGPAAAADPARGSFVQLDGAGDGGNATVVVLGQADVLRNGDLADDANAALALRVLGHNADLVWLVPDPARTADAGPASLTDLLPPWFRWVVLDLVVVAILALLWRGRRLGPVVREPLPVVVRAGETVQGRARLYRRARATDRAAATLRTAVLRRLARRLAVPPDADPDAVAVRVAQASGRDLDDVRRVLLGPAPRDERDLVRLADELDVVERDGTAGGVAGGERGEDRR
jgi:hypothetical protein